MALSSTSVTKPIHSLYFDWEMGTIFATGHRTFCGLAILFLFSVCCAQIGVAQSTVISTSSSSTNSQELVPSNLAHSVIQLEQKLRQPWKSEFNSFEKRFADFVSQLSSAGIPAVIHESARENNLDEDTLITLTLGGVSMDAGLSLLLDPYQCSYTIDPSGLVILHSDDFMYDYLQTVIYDVGAFTATPEEITDSLQQSIDPDGWDLVGGEGTISKLNTNGRRLLVVSTTYQNHRQIRDQLGDVTMMAKSQIATQPLSRSVGMGGSTPVQLPGEHLASRRNRKGMSLPGSGSTGGRGGAGLGGGVF